MEMLECYLTQNNELTREYGKLQQQLDKAVALLAEISDIVKLKHIQQFIFI